VTTELELAPRRPPRIVARRLYVPVMVGLTIAIGILAAQELAWTAGSPWAHEFAFGNGDLVGYLDGARRFLALGTPYLSGPLEPHSFIHPPIALALFVPFLWIPAILWWAIPLIGTAVLVIASTPRPWTWPLMALVLLWPRSQGAILAGNSDLWIMFVVALGVRFGWPIALLILKPTFAPLALLFVRDGQVRYALAGVGLIVGLGLIPAWMEWLAIVRRIDGGLVYSIASLPLVCLPLLGLRRAERDDEVRLGRRAVGGHGDGHVRGERAVHVGDVQVG